MVASSLVARPIVAAPLLARPALHALAARATAPAASLAAAPAPPVASLLAANLLAPLDALGGVRDPLCTVAVFEELSSGGFCHMKKETKKGYSKEGFWACRARAPPPGLVVV